MIQHKNQLYYITYNSIIQLIPEDSLTFTQMVINGNVVKSFAESDIYFDKVMYRSQIKKFDETQISLLDPCQFVYRMPPDFVEQLLKAHGRFVFFFFFFFLIHLKYFNLIYILK